MKTNNKKPKPDRPAPAKEKEPSREEIIQAAIRWSMEVESTIVALLDMLEDTSRELNNTQSLFAGLLQKSDVEEVRRCISNAWCMCGGLRPQNPLGLSFNSPAEILRDRKGGVS